jgi:hypothetical protein
VLLTLLGAHHHDRALLPDLRQRRQQAFLARWTAAAELFVTQLELVKFQIHGAPHRRAPCGARQTFAQPVSSLADRTGDVR